MSFEKSEIVVYTGQSNSDLQLEVRVENDTVWLNRQQLSVLFNRDIKTIGKHIANAIKEELEGLSVIAKFATTARDGKTYQVEHYNLDMIISIGYRVKSSRGVQFRVWANKVLKEYLLKGHVVNNRIEKVEEDVHLIKGKVKEIEFKLNTDLPLKQGVFFNGQIFDAWQFVSDLIRSADSSIILIDNYCDDTVLSLMSKRKKDVTAVIYTKSITKQLSIDLEKHNQQYPKIEVTLFKQSHDRFLIVDNDIVYHIGASLKDLGKKWFAFSRINIDAGMLIAKL